MPTSARIGLRKIFDKRRGDVGIAPYESLPHNGISNTPSGGST